LHSAVEQEHQDEPWAVVDFQMLERGLFIVEAHRHQKGGRDVDHPLIDDPRAPHQARKVGASQKSATATAQPARSTVCSAPATMISSSRRPRMRNPSSTMLRTAASASPRGVLATCSIMTP